MKLHSGRLALVMCAAGLLAACASAGPPALSPDPPATHAPATVLAHSHTPSATRNVWLTRTAVWLTRTAGPTSTPTPTRTPAPPSNTPRPSRTPVPTPTGTPTVTPNDLLAALSVRPAGSPTGHALHQIGGWEAGFRSAGYCRHGPYRWLDGEHLLLFPIVGIGVNEWGAPEYTQPVVFSLDGAAAWAAGAARPSCELPEWSASLERLITADDGHVRLWNVRGQAAGDYPGEEPLFIAPSGRRLLAGSTWIDLDSGRTVNLPDVRFVGPHKPAWSSNERRVFACCFAYADIDSQQYWFQTEFPGFFLGGRGSWPGEETWSVSLWLAGGERVMMQTYAIWPTAVGDPRSRSVIPIFEPAAQLYEDLLALLDLGTPPSCGAAPSPGGAHAWLGCNVQRGTTLMRYEPAYLVDLKTLQALPIPGRLDFQVWSSDGRFAAANEIPDPDLAAGTTWVLNVTGDRQRAAGEPATAVTWHAVSQAAMLRFADERWLRFFDAASGQVRDMITEQPVGEAVWQHAGPGIAYTTRDGRVWWLPDAFDSDADPILLAGPLPDLHSLKWAPGDERLAFVSQTGLYVITRNT